LVKVFKERYSLYKGETIYASKFDPDYVGIVDGGSNCNSTA